MSLRDLKNNVAVDLNFYYEFTSNITHTGAVIDTADYDGGIMFCFAAPAWTDGFYNPSFRENDTNSYGSSTLIQNDQLIGSLADATLNSATAEGDALPTIGLLSTKRYVWLDIVSVAVTDGATIMVTVNKVPELKPVA